MTRIRACKMMIIAMMPSATNIHALMCRRYVIGLSPDILVMVESSVICHFTLRIFDDMKLLVWLHETFPMPIDCHYYFHLLYNFITAALGRFR